MPFGKTFDMELMNLIWLFYGIVGTLIVILIRAAYKMRDKKPEDFDQLPDEGWASIHHKFAERYIENCKRDSIELTQNHRFGDIIHFTYPIKDGPHYEVSQINARAIKHNLYESFFEEYFESPKTIPDLPGESLVEETISDQQLEISNEESVSVILETLEWKYAGKFPPDAAAYDYFWVYVIPTDMVAIGTFTPSTNNSSSIHGTFTTDKDKNVMVHKDLEDILYLPIDTPKKPEP